MSVIGIVCEYNPFHSGHAWHIRQSRRAVPDSPVVCVMSGDFVQRGEAALFSKYARAEAAVEGGADLVIELPLPWCLSSAEGFAHGAVSLLAQLGATHLCFGSETGRIEELDELARELLKATLYQEIRDLMEQDASLSFAAAREKAVAARLGPRAELLRQPNNILAVEYLKAIYDLRLSMLPVAVLRRGSGHDRSGAGDFRSAAEIRKLLLSGRELNGDIPPIPYAVFKREWEAGRAQTERASMETALLSRLRMLDESAFLDLPDGGDGLGRRLYRAAHEEIDLDAILAAAKSKRYAMSRIRRLCMCACLGVTAEMSEGLPGYARVLAFNERGRQLLRQSAALGRIPLISKPAAVRELGPENEAIFALGANAHDLFVLGCRSRAERRPGMDWRTGPILLTEEAPEPPRRRGEQKK